MSGGAVLEHKLVGDISGDFHVPRYQRGYRWGPAEVQRLLDDIWHSRGPEYSLQPIVVKRMPARENEWELVDGQQRLTTLYLVFLYMQRAKLKNSGPTYSIRYATRPGSQAYLEELDAERSTNNIDYHHLYNAYECIRAWFERCGAKRQYVADKFYMYLFERVRVIWYEADPELDPTTLFTRLNVGRIPLTDAELVKALLLSRSRGEAGRSDRAHEMAAQWDAIERDLRDPDLWAFLTGTNDDWPTRITWLLDVVAKAPDGRKRPRYFTFDAIRERLEGDEERPAEPPEQVWNRVIDLHALVRGWYDNRDIYHKLGFLVAVGHHPREFVELAQRLRKSEFEAELDRRIRDTLNLTRSDVLELSYEQHGDRCLRVLLLMNVESIRRMRHSSERYSFRAHASGAWSLEHIHAQNTEGLTKVEQWQAWLRLHRDALAALAFGESKRRAQRDALIAAIDEALDGVGRETFYRLAREVNAYFSADEDPEHSVHSIANLALLERNDNSALSNSVFEVKRRRILELDRAGRYIPICTRRVFLKYYADASAQQVHFWSVQDRERYLDAMLSPDHGVIYPYLKPEEREP